MREHRSPTVNRRTALLMLAGGPFLALAATGRPTKRLGILFALDPERDQRIADVLKSLAERGYALGSTLEIRQRLLMARDKGTAEDLDRDLVNLAREIVAWRPDAILTMGTFPTRTLQALTRTIPVVTSTADPVGSGFAESMRKPGGNITGLSVGLPETSAKSMELLRQLVPSLKRVAILHHVDPMNNWLAGFAQRAAKDAGLEPVIVSWNDGEEQIRLLRSLPSKQILAGFYSAPVRDRAPVAAREAIGARVPLVTNLEPLVEDGMLASVEAVNHAYGERTAAIIEQVFRGANPAGIPIEFPRQFRVVVNRSTAAALRIALPPEVLLRADRVID